MCVSQVGKWFGATSTDAASQQLAIAQQQQQQAQVAVANANLDTEQSRTAAETAMRRAALSNGFASTVFGQQQSATPVAFKALYGG